MEVGMSKIGLSVLIAGVAGIIAGILFFLLKKTPSPETCKNSGPLKREFLLNAVLVSSLLSCFVFFCSTKLSAQDKQENATEQKTAAANDIKTDFLIRPNSVFCVTTLNSIC